MQRTHYDILDLPENANDTAIRRAAASARERVSADAALSPGAREAALTEIDTALRTLSTAATREAYDARLQQAHLAAGSGGGVLAMLRSPLIWGGVGLIALLFGGGYVLHEREQARERAERERVVAEQREAARVKEAAERVEKEKRRIAEEIRTLKDAEEQSHQKALEARQEDMKQKQFTADERYVPPQDQRYSYQTEQADAWRRRAEAQQQRYEDESNLRRAQQEVERQRRYLQQREREEAEALYRREAAARR